AVFLFHWTALVVVDTDAWDSCVESVPDTTGAGAGDLLAARDDLIQCRQLLFSDIADVAAATVFVAVALQTVIAGVAGGLRRRLGRLVRAFVFGMVAVAVIGTKVFYLSFDAVSWVSAAAAILGAFFVLLSDELSESENRSPV